MDCLVVDIDDTIIDTARRRWAVFREVLGFNITLDEVNREGSKEILDKRSPRKLKKRNWSTYWRVLLCFDKRGVKFLKYDEPKPMASQILKKLALRMKLIYLTSRTTNMRELTIDELRRFKFPLESSELVMCDDLNLFIKDPTAMRRKLFSYIAGKYDVKAVIDDYPRYFQVYREFKVPERIGLLRKPRFSVKEYLANGATRVVKGWEELKDWPQP